MEKVKLIPHKVILVDSIPDCYFCEQNGLKTAGPYDFATKMGPWANGCEKHWRMYGANPTLGTGKGQLWVTADQVDGDPADDGRPDPWEDPAWYADPSNFDGDLADLF